MTERDVIDRSALDTLREMFGDDDAFLAEMIDTYLSDAPQLLGDLRSASAAGDAEGLRRAAHSLKSNSETFGAGALAQICRTLEERCKQGALDGAEALVAQAEAAYEPVRLALLSR